MVFAFALLISIATFSSSKTRHCGGVILRPALDNPLDFNVMPTYLK